MTISYVRDGEEIVLDSSNPGNEDYPRVAGLTNGGFAMTWSAYDFATQVRSIKVQMFDADGQKLGSETGFGPGGTLPVVAGLSDGGLVIAYETGFPYEASSQITAQLFAADGSMVGGSFQVATGGSVQNLEATALDDGRFLLSWVSLSNPAGLHAQIFDADGAKVGTEFAPSNPDMLPQYGGVTASFADGSFVMSWYESYGVAKAQMFSADGLPTTAAFDLSSTHLDREIPQSIAILADGSFAVVWRRTTESEKPADSGKIQLFAHDGTKIGGVKEISAGGTPYSDFQAVGLADGGFVVTWSDSRDRQADQSSYKVTAQFFDGAGNKLGGEWQVNKEVLGNQNHPTIASLVNGGFVIGWDHANYTLSTDDIQAAIFAPSDNVAPVFTSNEGLSAFTVNINSDSINVLYVTATDANPQDKVSYNIVGGADADRFVITTAGTLRFKAWPGVGDDADHDGRYDVVVAASDGALSATQNISVLVNNDYPKHLSGNAGVDIFFGSSGKDALYGHEGDDILWGLGGDDILDGGTGADTMRGEYGNDAYFVDDAGDIVVEYRDGGKFDTVFSTISYVAPANIESVKLLGTADIDATARYNEFSLLSGNEGRNILTGGQYADYLYGRGGDDHLIGGGGNDQLFGGDGFDVAVFSGLASGYELQAVSEGVFRLVDIDPSNGSDATDTLTGVERIRFSDGATIDLIDNPDLLGLTAVNAALILA